MARAGIEGDVDQPVANPLGPVDERIDRPGERTAVDHQRVLAPGRLIHPVEHDPAGGERISPGKVDDQLVLVDGFKGLYFGRALSFMNKTWDWSTEQAEEEILAQARLFHERRDYLIKKLED